MTQVTFDDSGTVTVGVAELTPAALALAARYHGDSDHAVRVEKHDPLHLLTGRQDDAPPYYAGGRIRMAGGSGHWCTSGFAARSTVNRDYYLLTANHCVNLVDRRFWDGGGDFADVAGQAALWHLDLTYPF